MSETENDYDYDQMDNFFPVEDNLTNDDLDSVPEHEDDSPDYTEMVMKEPSNSKDPIYLTYEACRIIAISRGIPNINELFGTHEKREHFLSQQLQIMPPATPLQVDLVTSLFSPTDNIGNLLQFMDKTEEFIQSKKDFCKPSIDQLDKAQTISSIKKISIPKPVLLNSGRLQDWIDIHE